MMKDWKGRVRASGIHLGLSLCIAALAAILVFMVWYPYPYREISGGRNLFLLLVTVDVIMGPLITLAIFNRSKPRRELVMDLTVVAVLQLAALGYGLWTVFVARPVHLVFEYNRMSVVHAIEVEPEQLAKAPQPLRQLPLMGPTPIALRPFKNSTEQMDATMAALGGAALGARTDLWQPYSESVERVLQEAKPATELHSRFKDQTALLDGAIAATGRPVSQLHYLPLVARGNSWTVLLDSSTAEPVGYVPIESF